MNVCLVEWSVVSRPLPMGGGCKDTAHSVRWTGRKMTNYPGTQAPDSPGFRRRQKHYGGQVRGQAREAPNARVQRKRLASSAAAISLQFALIRFKFCLARGPPPPPSARGFRGTKGRRDEQDGRDARAAGTVWLTSARVGSHWLGYPHVTWLHGFRGHRHFTCALGRVETHFHPNT